jgi:hypothetical protein
MAPMTGLMSGLGGSDMAAKLGCAALVENSAQQFPQSRIRSS